MSDSLAPNTLVFRPVLSIRYLETPPRIDGRLDQWDDAHLLEFPPRIDGLTPFADSWMGWTEDGLYCAFRIRGKPEPPHSDRRQFWEADGIRLFTDMRDTRNIHRAGRYCQQWYFLPGCGDEGGEAVAGSAPIHRARENAPAAEPEQIAVASQTSDDGYSIEAAIPAQSLSGFDPSSHNRIGLYYYINDRRLGGQFLTVGDELPYATDPSLWASGILEK
jgi:hypothetical protein